MAGYRALKAKLTAEFASDEVLKRRILAAGTIDEILVALANSYQAALVMAGDWGARGETQSDLHVEGAERAAEAREAAILELMAFFDRTRAGTPSVEIEKTGPRHLRVVCRGRAATAAATDAG